MSQLSTALISTSGLNEYHCVDISVLQHGTTFLEDMTSLGMHGELLYPCSWHGAPSFVYRYKLGRAAPGSWVTRTRVTADEVLQARASSLKARASSLKARASSLLSQYQS